MCSPDETDRRFDIDRRTLLRVGTAAAAGTLGGAGTVSAQSTADASPEALHSGDTEVVAFYENDDGYVVMEADLETDRIRMSGAEKAGFIDELEAARVSRRIRRDGVVPQNPIDRYWDPKISLFSGTRGSCDHPTFSYDYQAGVAVDSGIPSVRWISNSTLKSWAVDFLCVVLARRLPVGKALDKLKDRVPGLSDGSASDVRLEKLSGTADDPTVSPQAPPAAILLLALVVAMKCDYFMEPLVDSLLEGAATRSIYDAHAPYWDNGTAVASGVRSGYHTSTHSTNYTDVVAPGWHIGMVEEY